jgi:hypothetical protein
MTSLDFFFLQFVQFVHALQILDRKMTSLCSSSFFF